MGLSDKAKVLAFRSHIRKLHSLSVDKDEWYRDYYDVYERKVVSDHETFITDDKGRLIAYRENETYFVIDRHD